VVLLLVAKSPPSVGLAAPTSVAPGAGTQAPAVTVAAQLSNAAAPSLATSLGAEPLAARAESPREPAASPLYVARPRTIRVEVVEQHSSKPLPHALVWLRKPGMTDAPDPIEVERLGWARYLESWAEAHTADANGQIALRGVEGFPLIVASWFHLQGSGLAPAAEGSVLRVNAQSRFVPVVHIVDVLGTPATGVAHRFEGGSDGIRRIWSGGSAADARIPLFPDKCAELALGRAITLEVRPFGGTWQSFALDRSFLVETPTALTLGETGQLEIRLVGAALADLPQSIPARVERFTEGPLNGQSLECQLVDGYVRCAGVALGLDLEVAAEVPGFVGASPTVRCKGPLRAGEVVAVDIPLTPWATLSGRVLDASLQPIVNSSLRLDWANRGDGVMTDAAGRIWIPLTERASETFKGKLGIRFRGGRADVDVPVGLRGAIDLGDIVLGASTVLASGRVVDVDGRPIAGADMEASYRTGEAAEPGTRSIGCANGQTDADGTFTLRGHGAAERLFVSATRVGFVASGLTCKRGASGLEIRMPPAATLIAELLVDEPEQTRGVVLGLDWAALKGWTNGTDEFDLGFDGGGAREEWTGLPAGLYDVHVRVRGTDPHAPPPQLLAVQERLRGISIRQGETRHVEVDLRGLLGSVRVRVLSADGDALPLARVRLPHGSIGVDADGRASITTFGADIAVAVECVGWFGERAQLVSGKPAREFRLQPAPAIRLRATAPPLEAGEQLDWSCVDSADPNEHHAIRAGALESGERWYPPHAGRFEFRASLGRDRVGVYVALHPPVVLDVRSDMPDTQVELSCNQAGLEQARQALQKVQKKLEKAGKAK
jgi:hypothetical protein